MQKQININNKHQRAAKTVTKRAQELPKAAQDPIKTAQKPPQTVQRGPKSPQERPKTPPKTTQDPPRSALGTVLEPSWDQPITRSKKGPSKTVRVQFEETFWVDFGAQNDAKNDPKTTQNESKIKTKNASFFIALGLVLDRS